MFYAFIIYLHISFDVSWFDPVGAWHKYRRGHRIRSTQVPDTHVAITSLDVALPYPGDPESTNVDNFGVAVYQLVSECLIVSTNFNISFDVSCISGK